ncbi:MAG TPA: Os1348 family NHLP clan protein [Thermoanaerobaculia bacterium]|nr:Os1348 family NHLP clan protein [Thermoanaerobaculia bacterium]
MSQKTVEIVLGKLVTDEEVRRRFRAAPLEVLESVRRAGCDLSAVEATALRSLDPAALERFALSLDPRLQKASLQTHPNDGHPEET